MKISTKTEYGLRALIYLAECPVNRPCSVAEIAKEQGLSVTFLEKIVGQLKKSGIVKSLKGVRGGYMLARNLEEINIRQIIEALEGDLAPYQQMIEQKKNSKLHCKSHLVWALLQQKMVDSLESVKLKDVININLN